MQYYRNDHHYTCLFIHRLTTLTKQVSSALSDLECTWNGPKWLIDSDKVVIDYKETDLTFH